ncbi:AAC(3) family N-acetyltransferase [Candidatus Poribacteria bacterium]|nr:AAC(3) family N-acetyltransferase [Candidatus Poribacteria bacterium]MYA56787.1 AAC(3) family N-acetyltransferase [Candidatus Poribacteria bacterium]
MKTPHTREKLTQDFTDLGIAQGDTLFIHSSFKSLGSVEDGASTVIAALETAVGAEGLILMPTFSLLPSREERVAAWDVNKTPSTVGWLTEFFRQMFDTHRSDHYSHAIAARGRDAKAFVSDHRRREGYQSPWDHYPWGKTYGTHSPMFRAYKANAKLLMLGVDYQTSTYIHLVEVIHWNKRLADDPQAEYIRLKRPELGEYWERLGQLKKGKVGDSVCRLFHIETYVDSLLAEVERNPEPYVV